MLFSVMIPVYNVKDYLKDCVESIFDQDFIDYEVILIDDGSTDGSSEICDLIKKEHPEVVNVVHQNNMGLLMARRNAIKLAKGDYFLFVDSDDSVGPCYFSKLKTLIENYEPDLILFHADKWNGSDVWYYREPFINQSKMLSSSEYNDLLLATMKHSISNGIWTKCVSRKIVDIEKDYSTVQKVSLGEDLLQSLPILDKAKSIFYLNEKLYRYRVNENSMTRSFNFSLFYSINEVNKALNEYAQKWENEGHVINACELVNSHYICEVWEVIKRLIISNERLFTNKVYSFYDEISNDSFYINQLQQKRIDNSCVMLLRLLQKKKYKTMSSCLQILRAGYRMKKLIRR